LARTEQDAEIDSVDNDDDCNAYDIVYIERLNLTLQTKWVVANDYMWVNWREAGERGMGSKAGECLRW
jgi:hypothetical protein